MRPSDLPNSRSPPKTYKEGGKVKKRKRDPSHQSRSSEQSSEHRTAEAEVGNHSIWRGANRGLRGVRLGRGGGRQLPPPARCEEPSGSNNRGGKKPKARKRKPKRKLLLRNLLRRKPKKMLLLRKPTKRSSNKK